MRFANPEAFWLLLLLPLYGLWRLRAHSRSRGLPFPALSLFEGIRRPQPWLNWLSGLSYLLSALTLTAALARPQQGHEFIHTTQKGIDIMLAVDVSASMLAEDFSPNRLVAARRVLDSFIARQQGNRLGVVVFSGRSFTLIPLTTDYHLVADSVATIVPEMVREQGTAIGDAIANAIYRLRKQNTPSKVIILLTDGENTAGDTLPIVAAQMARQMNIRIHVIGIGRPEGVPVPVLDPRTHERVYLRNPDGSLYRSRIKEYDLQQIASLTGGLYFRADNENTLTSIYEQINKMEKTEFESRKRTVYSEQMMWFLVPGAALLLLMLMIRWTRGQVLEAANG
ncbi:MAG: VWA domain-containing protein [Candidatus Sericytochromatia bacterium]